MDGAIGTKDRCRRGERFEVRVGSTKQSTKFGREGRSNRLRRMDAEGLKEWIGMRMPMDERVDERASEYETNVECELRKKEVVCRLEEDEDLVCKQATTTRKNSSMCCR